MSDDKLLRESGNDPDNGWTPLVPQHRRDNKWQETGDKNPMPNQLYTKDAEGNFVEVTEDNPVPMRLVGSNIEDGILTKQNKDFIEVDVPIDELGEGKNSSIDVHANEGEIWTLKRFGYYIERDMEATGTHFVWLYHGNSQSNSNFIMSIDGDVTKYLRGTIPGRREDQHEGDIRPRDLYEMVESIRGTTVLSDKLPIKIRYSNRSDGPMPGGHVKLFFEVEKVSKV